MRGTTSRWALGALMLPVAALIAVAVTTSKTQPASAAAQLRPGIALAGITEMQVPLSSALRTRLSSTKQKANLQLLQQSYIMRNNRTFFRLPTGGERQLLPLAAEAPPSAAKLQASRQLPSFMLKYNNLIMKLGPITIIPTVVDHRSKQTPVKDQQQRGTCVCFASMAGLEVAYNSTTLDLSEQYANYLFMKAESRSCKDDGLYTYDSADYLTANKVCRESYCPYQYPIASWCNGGNPATAKRAAIGTNALYGIASHQKIWRDESADDAGPYINNPHYLESILDAGKDIVLGTHVAGWTGNVTGLVDVKLNSNGDPLPSVGGHAMLIVGYDRSKTTYPEEYFIVKNSWGTGIGQAGYLYLSYDYIRTYAKYGYYITGVKPVMLPMRVPVRRLP